MGTMNTPTVIDESLCIESRLGAGGGGAVYKAWHMRLQKYVVIKEFKCGSSAGVGARRNEVEALKNVKSPYLPQVYDYLEEGGRALTVMEYIEGESFDRLLGRGRNFTQSEVIKWYAQLASALEALHGQNICHRDIKPSNIMLTPDGDVCLVDFNAAFVRGNSVRFLSRSLGYASPEQYETYEWIKKSRAMQLPVVNAQCRMKVDGIDWRRSDIYSLGAAIYHILTGKRPHERAQEVTAISKLGRFNAALIRIIEKSMQPEPPERYTSAEALADAICCLQKRRSTAGTSLTLGEMILYGVTAGLGGAALATTIINSAISGTVGKSRAFR